jgi:hypothetical protein
MASPVILVSYDSQVDGLGNALASFDDPNVPSLLAMPLLGYPHYDPALYDATRARILSPANRRAARSAPCSCGCPLKRAQRAGKPVAVRVSKGLNLGLLMMPSC